MIAPLSYMWYGSESDRVSLYNHLYDLNPKSNQHVYTYTMSDIGVILYFH